ncbi:uroporphyrinogen-III synthase [Ollibium composti]|uniref:Uroporphyrinogen-III synthase n=1 Tax=Ollibium composti TaxID=2675109 RepID=A0ABY2Q897_9HYPH|nr:uroporphyrinogen-III synthase [Mesorhizobium composti]THF57533.1 uroporphyrinogen-III synthase [Mesorhizobium composti]
MRRVLVTRPEPGATRTAGRLRQLGFEPLVLPLSATKPLAVDDAAVPDDAAAVAVTSANALRHAPHRLIGRLTALACHAVGERTAAAAQAAGFHAVEAGPGDAAGLAEAIAPQLVGKRLVYLCGRERFPLFEDRLAEAGVRITAIETYDTVAVEPPDATVLSLLGGRAADAVLLYSVKAAEAAARLVRHTALIPALENAAVFCLSARIDAAFRVAGDGKGARHVAATPDEEALMALLRAKG